MASSSLQPSDPRHQAALRLEPKGLLFDMDGVLIDSFAAWYASFAIFMESHLGQRIERNDFLSRFWGRDLRDIFAELEVDIAVETYCHRFFADQLGQVRLLPGVEQTLERLASYPKAIITNTPASCTEAILRETRLGAFFDAVLNGNDVERGKPDPDIIIAGCRRLGIEPGDALVIGDHQVDMAAGRNAGSTVVGINVDGDFRIGAIDELLDIIRADRAG